MPRLLFIFISTAMLQLFEGGYYSKYRRHSYCLFQLYRNAATIRGRLLFEVQTSQLLFISALPQCGNYSRAGYYSKYRRHSYCLFQHYRNAATIRGQATIRSTDVTATVYFHLYRNAATIRGQATIRSTDVTATIYFHLYRNAATIRGQATIRSTDVTATVYFSTTGMRRLFESGYYSRGATIRGMVFIRGKYGIIGILLF